MTTTTNIDVNALIEEFTGSAFVDENGSLGVQPYCQAIRGEQKAPYCGLFITMEQYAGGQWVKEPTNAQKITYPFGRGKDKTMVDGYVFQAPRLLVVAKSPVLAVSKQATEQGREVMGLYDAKNKIPGTTNQSTYLVFFLDEENQLLHLVPYKLNARGAFGASFGQSVQAFWREFNLVFNQKLSDSIGKLVPLKPKNAMFNCLVVFCPTFEAEEAGTEITSLACKVKEYVKPTVENVLDLFVGSNDEVKCHVIAMTNPLEMTYNVPQLAPAVPVLQLVNKTPQLEAAYADVSGDYDDQPF